MRRPHPWTAFKYGIWKPFICWLRRHKIKCYSIIPAPQLITGYLHICHRCMRIEEHRGVCGHCDNCRNAWKDESVETNGIAPVCRECRLLIDHHPIDHDERCSWRAVS